MIENTVVETSDMKVVYRQDFNALLVLYPLLIDAPKKSMGRSLEDLKEKISLQQGAILSILDRLIKEGVVKQRLLQIGSGGTSDYFYKLVGGGTVTLTVSVSKK